MDLNRSSHVRELEPPPRPLPHSNTYLTLFAHGDNAVSESHPEATELAGTQDLWSPHVRLEVVLEEAVHGYP